MKEVALSQIGFSSGAVVELVLKMSCKNGMNKTIDTRLKITNSVLYTIVKIA